MDPLYAGSSMYFPAGWICAFLPSIYNDGYYIIPENTDIDISKSNSNITSKLLNISKITKYILYNIYDLLYYHSKGQLMKYILYFVLTFTVFNIVVGKSQADSGNNDGITREEIIFSSENRLLEATVNSSKIILTVDADFSDGRILNNSTAKLLGLKRSLIGGGVIIGNTRLNADSSKRPFSILNMPEKKARLHWFDRDIVVGADGLVSATSLPFENVIFQFREQETHDKKSYIPFKKPGNWGFTGGYGILTVDDKEFRLGFALERPETMVSADLATLLEQSNGGFFEGDIVFKEIRYSVTLPMRLMHFAIPFHVGSLSIASAYVYWTEPGKEGLNDDNLAQNPDEIVVTGKKRRSHLAYNISVGSEDLTRCASLTFRNIIGTIEMDCH